MATRREIREIIKITLEVLNERKAIDCNDYQRDDFYKLFVDVITKCPQEFVSITKSLI